MLKLKDKVWVWNHRLYSWFLTKAVTVARATEPGFDQLIPLCFCRSDTTKSFAFSPWLLELRKPNRFLTE